MPTLLQIPGHALGACKEAINKSATDALHAYRKQVSQLMCHHVSPLFDLRSFVPAVTRWPTQPCILTVLAQPLPLLSYKSRSAMFSQPLTRISQLLMTSMWLCLDPAAVCLGVFLGAADPA